MSLLRRQPVQTWDPFRDFQDLSDRLNRVFSGHPLNQQHHEVNREQALTVFDWAPSVNISETDKAYLIKADLPEVKKEEVKVTSHDGVLTIEGERRQEKREDNEKYHRVESSYGKFMRRFTLPDDAQDEAIEATFKDGTLNVTIPKAAAKRPKSREIRVS
jgi:HSP20 family protein